MWTLISTFHAKYFLTIFAHANNTIYYAFIPLNLWVRNKVLLWNHSGSLPAIGLHTSVCFGVFSAVVVKLDLQTVRKRILIFQCSMCNIISSVFIHQIICMLLSWNWVWAQCQKRILEQIRLLQRNIWVSLHSEWASFETFKWEDSALYQFQIEMHQTFLFLVQLVS